MAVAAAREVPESFDRAPASEHSVADDESKGRGTRAVPVIRHWEVTARVQKGFLSLFSSFLDFCLLFLIFLLTWASMFGLLGASVEVCTEVLRVRAST